ncbi:hypothetical protein NP493_28g03019 [Ridgeia piscesae]|uniref:PX domain-containing protein n=1 Tax=Ridgeia piscesae TaxID=27915 RepID=A0AAD9UKB6_RIDPI|nr:hypothetical protein NP493_28g03019 [Ridgeia piscesae]
MMHFSIPDTAEHIDASGGSFTVFNIHINGVPHCSVRYRQFHNFFEELKREFGTNAIPPFPPKKLFSLTAPQLEERRLGLERFVQQISQEHTIATSNTFNHFLLMAQQETLKEKSENVALDVYLMNGNKLTVNIVSTDQRDDVLEAVAAKLDLAEELVYYFGLFLVKKEAKHENEMAQSEYCMERSGTVGMECSGTVGMERSGTVGMEAVAQWAWSAVAQWAWSAVAQCAGAADSQLRESTFKSCANPKGGAICWSVVSHTLLVVAVVRKLQEFESPYISLKAANRSQPHGIVLRKSYWDASYDDDLIDDRIALNLLYIQAVSDIERDWIIPSKEQQKQLSLLRQRGSKKEFLQLARTVKFYGYLQFRPCHTDFSSASQVLISAGNKELVFRHQATGDVKEVTFRVTRMRCWRITSTVLDEDLEAGDRTSPTDPLPCRLELAFEYLFGKDNLKWVTVKSDQVSDRHER